MTATHPVKKFFFLFLFSWCWFFAYSQQTDSARFVTAAWKKERLGPGVRLVTHQFDNNALFASNQYISYAIIKNKKRRKGFNIAAEAKLLKPVPVFGEETGALVALNGNFFNVKEGGSVDYVKVNGQVISENLTGADGTLKVHQKAAVAVQGGKLVILKGDSPRWPDSIAAGSVLANGPLLCLEGASVPVEASSFSETRHPRTAVGVTAGGRVILLVADGRNTNAAGLRLEELRKIMQWLGCVSAINFDGGGSSTLWTRKKGVINHPSDNKKWDHEGVRSVANVLYYKR
ncbi:phosphodiester glycosidase family protein [Niabella beijingensis]|uniref:phosphodiester glycosidase family protein n=1 Tax=Niabella beijingensis TaxID=2872700 RepID=UPI001CBCABAB|nr:phosphodiester glycosidase family protein [Niabella beijingensis]MBZ4190689.1 phosphodiester glycosidase family protein [Niabella beijingensis]